MERAVSRMRGRRVVRVERRRDVAVWPTPVVCPALRGAWRVFPYGDVASVMPFSSTVVGENHPEKND